MTGAGEAVVVATTGLGVDSSAVALATDDVDETDGGGAAAEGLIAEKGTRLVVDVPVMPAPVVDGPEHAAVPTTTRRAAPARNCLRNEEPSVHPTAGPIESGRRSVTDCDDPGDIRRPPGANPTE
jgi:hypothetical protein